MQLERCAKWDEIPLPKYSTLCTVDISAKPVPSEVAAVIGRKCAEICNRCVHFVARDTDDSIPTSEVQVFLD